MEKELLIYHSGNEVRDICIANGLCKLLQMNDIKYKLVKRKDCYLISHEDFNYNNALYFSIEENDCNTCNSSLNKSERSNAIEGTNKFILDNVTLIFNYFSTYNNKLLKDIKKEGSLGIGTFFNTKSIRASTSPGALNTTALERTIAFLGWINSTNYTTNDDVEVNAILIPSKMDRILRPFEYKSQDKETNEIKTRHYFGKQYKKSDVLMQAEIYVNTIAEYLTYRENKDESVVLETILFMVLTKAGQKPIPNKFYKLPVYSWSKELYLKFGELLSFSFVELDIKDITARFIVKPSLSNFHKLIQIYSKKEQKLDCIYRGDLLNMFENRVQEIHNNEVVKKLGRGLNVLLYNKKGFEILTKLYTVRTVESLSYRIREIEDGYLRYNKYTLLTETEHRDIINLINSKKDSVICANAIISYGRVFYEKKIKQDKGTTNNNLEDEIIYDHYEEINEGNSDNKEDEITSIVEQITLNLSSGEVL